MEVVKPSLGIEVVASVADGVGVGQGAGGGQDITPGVVGVGGQNCAGGGDHLLHIALLVLHQEALGLAGGRLPGVSYHLPIGIIVEVEGIVNTPVNKQLAAVPDVVSGDVVECLGRSQSALVVAEAESVGAVGHAGQLPSALPGHGPAR